MEVIANSYNYKDPVSVIPLAQYFTEKNVPGADTFKEFKEKKIVVSEDHERLYSVVSNKKQVIFHEDGIQAIHDAIEHIYDAPPIVNVTSMSNGARIMAKFDLPVPEEICYDAEDKSTLSLLFFNSYDQGLATKVRTGLFRQICSNGMVVGDDIASMTAKQFTSEGLSPDALAPNLERLIARTKKIEEFWESWKHVEIPAEIGIALIEKFFSKKLCAHLIDESVYPMLMWKFYNELTRISTHDTSTYRANVVTDLTLSRLFYGSRSILRNLDGMSDRTVAFRAENNEEAPALAIAA